MPAPHARTASAGRSVALCLHGVGQPGRPLEEDEGRYWLTEDRFAEIMGVVADRRPSTVITFDDSNESDVTLALPILVELGLRAEFYVLAGRLDQPGSLSSGQVAALARAGMTIGTHGMHHRAWRSLRTEGDFHEELIEARDLLEKCAGTPVTAAACPFGSYDRRVLRRLRKAGYQRVYTVDGGSSRPGAWLHSRLTLEDTDSAESVEAFLADPDGGMTTRAARAGRGLVKRLR